MKIKSKTSRGKKLSAILFASLASLALVAQAIFMPLAASAVEKSEAGVKLLFYRSAVYDCLKNNSDLIKNDISIGQPIKDIFNYDAAIMSYANAGAWVGDHDSGSITCWDAIQNANFTGNITEESLKSGKILDGVFDKVTSKEKQLFCSYLIVLDDESDYYRDASGNVKTYWWPQGFSSNDKNSLGLSRHGFYYNDDGWVNKGDKVNLVYEGVNYDIDTFEEASSHATFDSSNFKKVCHDLVTGISVLAYDTFDAGDGQKGVSIKPVKNTGNDCTPLNEWGPADWVNDFGNAAFTCANNMNYETKDTGKSTALTKKSGAESALANNLKKLWFDNKEPKAYYDSVADFKYIVYGRALFNGDSGYPLGCNGISLEATKENKEWATNNSVWNFGNDYVQTMKAYKKKDASSKTEYITKYGYGGKDDAGYMSSIIPLTPWDSGVWSCSDLVGKFNSATASDKKAKQAVITYMNAAEKTDDIAKPDDPTKPKPNPDNPDEEKKTESEKLEEACYRQAKSLGWIICPMVFGLEEVSKGIYQQVEPMIRVNDTVIGQLNQGNSGGGEMFKAWNTFRGIANIIFVILFLFIIFSQLTGFGIDNYGIKKMLPKVIVTAILVNISFLICAVAVDISNILGKALQDLFIAIAPSSSVLSATSPVDGTIEIIVNVVAVIAIAGTSGIVIGTILMNGWAIIIPILLFLLVMVISIIFALIVLGLRQAFVVILVIVSPIAFACTLLPNTEAVFRKWKDFFKQILMVYPIVGGLIGAGYFVARMIYTSNADLIMSITAGILCVAPYFLVPSLTRKSLAMAGNIGERLRGLGQNAGRRVQNLNNTEAVRGIRGRSRDNALTRRGIDKLSMKAANWANGEGKGTKRAWLANHTIASRGRMASIARTNQNRVANSRETAYGQAANAVAERQRLESGGYDARNASIAGDSFSKAVKDYESLITNGEYIGENGQKIGQNDFEELGAELTKEMLKDNADEVKINALTNKMLGNGKKGLRALDKAYSNALSGGAGSKAIQGFSNNIKNNHADIADSMPSLFESAVKGAPSGHLGASYEQFNNEGIGSLNAAKMAKLDKQQLKKYLDGNGNFADYMNDTSRAQLSSLASQALSDERLKGDISVDNKELLEQIARAGNQPVPSARSLEGQSESFHSSATSTPTPAPTGGDSGPRTTTPAPANVPARTEAARSAGANAATVRATQISDATRARAAEHGRVNPDVERAIDQSNKGGGRQTDSGIWLPS